MNYLSCLLLVIISCTHFPNLIFHLFNFCRFIFQIVIIELLMFSRICINDPICVYLTAFIIISRVMNWIGQALKPNLVLYCISISKWLSNIDFVKIKWSKFSLYLQSHFNRSQTRMFYTLWRFSKHILTICVDIQGVNNSICLTLRYCVFCNHSFLLYFCRLRF